VPTLHTDVVSRIQKLSASVVNKIAAGEVIERPASAVKELLENSVDALATRIEVDIVQGGTELIRICDDGEGIHPDDLELAVTSHATSKIENADDLFRVHTLGFRGEALASIAEVSRFRIRSRPHDEPQGMELDVECGIVKEPRPCGCPPGTTIEVRQLFFNTPVRRKFLRSPATEFAHIVEQFTRIALAYPRLHLVLRHNDKPVHELPATAQLLDRLELFLGGELARQLIPVESEHGGVRLWGYVAHPGQSKSTRKGQYLFLNGRWIQDRALQHALSEAYRGLLMVGRYPIAFLFLEMPSDLVDVNVHPTKCEVRFQDGQRLYRQLLSTLRSRFLGMNLDSVLSVGPRTAATVAPTDPAEVLRAQQELAAWAKDQLANWQPKEDLSDLHAVFDELDRREAERAQRFVEEGQTTSESFTVPPPTEVTAAVPLAPPHSGPGGIVHVATADAAQRPASASAELREGLTVIDQHALHERILYEHLRRRVLAGGVEVQQLLIPVTVELTSREAGLLLDQTDVLAELGLHVESFGGQTVAVTGYPTILAKADPAELLRSVVEYLESGGAGATRRDLLDSLLHMLACKAAIKAGHRLSPEEIESLLAQRTLVDDHHHCPHGRPTSLTLSRAELDRQFGRLG
jgi:DNA mismatch repair protein MutL